MSLCEVWFARAFASVGSCILANPLRAKWVERKAAWAFSGTVAPGYPDLHSFEDDLPKPKTPGIRDEPQTSHANVSAAAEPPRVRSNPAWTLRDPG